MWADKGVTELVGVGLVTAGMVVWFPDPSLFNRMREGEGRVWANARPSHGPRLECEKRC